MEACRSISGTISPSTAASGTTGSARRSTTPQTSSVGDILVAPGVDDIWSRPDRHDPAHLSLPRRYARLLEVHARLEAGHLQRHGLVVHGRHDREPETIDAFETGLRGSGSTDASALEASLFYYNYRDYQIFIAQQFAGGQPEFVI